MATLDKSFVALYSALERPRIARRAVVALLLMHTALLSYSAYVHSPTNNEPAHLVAGISHWRYGRFELYRVNPPLVRMVAALPVMAVGCNEDWSEYYDGPGARSEMPLGSDFIAANGPRSFFLFMIARWACMPFSWIGAITCFLWARDLYGRPAGVLACTIWCFEPNILAHASLITPDAHAAALGLAACYTFWRWLKRPTWTQAALTGVVLGLAELAKTTLVIFLPLWPLMWITYRWPERRAMQAKDWLREAGMLVLRIVVGLNVLNLGYAFEGTFTPIGQMQFVSDVLTRGFYSTQHEPAGVPGNRFAGTWLGEVSLPVPRNYVLGIDTQQRDFEHYGRPSYLRGEWQNRGWWYYYLYAAAIKVPLALWLLGIVATTRRMYEPIRFLAPGYTLGPALRDEVVLLTPTVVILTVVSAKTGFSEHFRYALPALPYVFIAISSNVPIARVFLTLPGETVVSAKAQGATFMRHWGAITLVCSSWFVASSLWVYPHSLAYFNESIGGPRCGPEHLRGSNVDWGQDLRYVIQWRDRFQPSSILYFRGHGLFEPSDLAPQVRTLHGSESIRGQAQHMRKKYFVISANDDRRSRLGKPGPQDSNVQARSIAAQSQTVAAEFYSSWISAAIGEGSTE